MGLSDATNQIVYWSDDPAKALLKVPNRVSIAHYPEGCPSSEGRLWLESVSRQATAQKEICLNTRTAGALGARGAHPAHGPPRLQHRHLQPRGAFHPPLNPDPIAASAHWQANTFATGWTQVLWRFSENFDYLELRKGFVASEVPQSSRVRVHPRN